MQDDGTKIKQDAHSYLCGVALKKRLLQYAKEKRIATGLIFVTRTGKPVSRTNIWRDMLYLSCSV